jgi:hypothetical protein
MRIEPLGNGRYRVTVEYHAPDAEDVWLSAGRGRRLAERRRAATCGRLVTRSAELEEGAASAGSWRSPSGSGAT